MRKIFTLVICLFTTFCHGQVEDILELGRVALTIGKYKEAIKHFDKVINLNPGHENAMLLRSQANYSMKNYELAIKDCERILEINPNVISRDDLTALWNLGVSHNSLRKFDKARGYFEELLKHDPENIRLYENIGYSYLEENYYDKALEQFRKMVSLNDRSEKGFYGIGKTYYLKGEFENSIKAFDKAIELNPDYGMAYQNRGSAKLELNDMDGCCADWRKCLALGMIQIKPYIEEYCE